ncbi:MAG: GTPase domain-containing protein [Candidatus Omnitrophota bacterium]
MSSERSNIEAAQTLVLSAERLRSFSFPEAAAEALLNLSALAALRAGLGVNRPVFAGFIGCTGTGKSTLFNSLAGRELSLTGWKTHNTRGPVMLGQDRFWRLVDELEKKLGKLLFPSLKREMVANGEKAAGAPGALLWTASSDPQWENTILIDLPDINTTLARDERLLAMQLMPWLDAAVFVVDDETLYHRDYESFAEPAATLQQSRFCVLNNRGLDQVDLNHRDLRESMRFFGVESIYVLPNIGRGKRFGCEPEFLRFREALRKVRHPAPLAPLFKNAAPLAQELLDENRRRREALQSLQESLSAEIQSSLAKEPPIELRKILHDDVIQALHHMGLKRFAVSNLYQFMKRTAKTGSLRESVQLAFGNRKDQILSHALHLDLKKLEEEVRQRLSDHRERLKNCILHHAESQGLMEIAPEFRAAALALNGSLAGSLSEAVQTFETQCRDLLASDSLKTSLKNDPLVALGVAAALAVDAFTLPGFGSWALAPSLFRYIPLGPFEKTKRKFQQNVNDIVRRTLLREIEQLNEIRRSIALEDADPILEALRTYSQNHEN